MSPPSLPSSAIGLAHILFIVFSLIPVTHGALRDVFHVKEGTTHGGCDEVNVDAWFADVVTLINAASEGVIAADPDSRKYLNTFFKIKPDHDIGPAIG